ncbi:hypothetical protein NE237_027213 [Protea cynaroides]|uniref:FBD domain-containing protein n=1 Tax=Protea cynaroides TaxID=273540 RepID=A0A9Q0GNW9_9MAGN|nr:hypothetical protein NE237_027213 [Protea cynaroides]
MDEHFIQKVENIWISIPNLDFDDILFHPPEKRGRLAKESFEVFVDRVLTLLDSSKIQSFQLHYLATDSCCPLENLEALNISVLTLQSLTITDIGVDKFEINAPGLVSLHYDDCKERDYSLGNLSEAAEAYIDVYTDLCLVKQSSGNGQYLCRLLRGVSSARVLSLSYNTIKRLDLTGWVWGVNLPKCLTVNLKTVEIRGFGGVPVELEVVEYFLKNAKALKKFTIIPSCQLTDPEKQMELEMNCRSFPECLGVIIAIS